MTTPGFDDPYLPLAFSISSTPQAHAILAGAGISRGAGVSTAWEVVTELAQRVCRSRCGDAAADALDTSNVDRWWLDEFGTPLEYSSILETLGATPDEREALLSGFFDPAGEPPVTSRAHTAVARLVASGHVRVIMTLNFDHLFETALAAEGIEPIIVRTDADAQGLAPLHTYQCVVIHLHGDYRHGVSMLNTVDELSGYGPYMGALLTSVLSNHALIAVGWSVTYDIALRKEVAAHTSRHHKSAWIDPRPTDAGRELARALDASVFEASADDALGRLADVVGTIGRRSARHPLTVRVAVDRIKDGLTGGHPAITAHDTFSTEYANAAEILQGYRADPTRDYHASARQEIQDASEVLCAATATLAYWGTAATDHWWTTAIKEHATHWPSSGLGFLEWMQLPHSLSRGMFYAAGVAATAARRYDALTELFGATTEPAYNTEPQHLPVVLAWPTGPQHRPSRERLAEIVSEALTLTPRRVDDAWQEFEVLRLLHQISTSNRAVEFAMEAKSRAYQLSEKAKFNDTYGMSTTPLDLNPYLNEVDQAYTILGQLCSASGCHLLATSKFDKWGHEKFYSPAVERLRNWPALKDIPFLSANLGGRDVGEAMLSGVNAAIDQAARRLPSHPTVWLDATLAD